MQNTLHQGFSTTDAICEGIDNSIDANATFIDIRYDPIRKGLIVADNGSGMTPDQLPEAYIMNNRSVDVDNTNEKHGRFGIGANVLPIVLTELLGNMSVVTKTTEMTHPCDMTMNFPIAISTGVFNRAVNTVDEDGTDNRSANSIQLWNEYASFTKNHS
jgi:DNA topoisomerase VI subunit B